MHAPDRQPKKRSAHIDDAANEASKRSAARRPAADDRAGAASAARGSASTASRAAKPPAFYVAVGVAVVAIVVACVLGFMAFSNAGQGRDPNAALGQLEGKTPEEVQAELDRIVEEGMLNISIASVIEFADGTAPGTAYIENVPGNHYAMKVRIVLDDTGDVVYESGGLKPGTYIETITLSQDLEPGSYPATATFAAYNMDTLEEVGQAGANINLEVLG